MLKREVGVWGGVDVACLPTFRGRTLAVKVLKVKVRGRGFASIDSGGIHISQPTNLLLCTYFPAKNT